MQRRYGDTVHLCLKLVWSRASEVVSNNGADIELNALASWGVTDKERGIMGELRDIPMSIEDDLKLKCIC